MTSSDEERLVGTISAERFQPFLKACGGDRTMALRLYAWDAEAARALSSPLRDLEVSLRNALNLQLAGRFKQADWWTLPKAEPSTWAMKEIWNAEDALARRRKPYGPSDIVAKLSFGFWTGLLGKGGNYEMKYWYPSLRHRFPGQNRQSLHDRLEVMRTLRNRIAHHERISHRHLDQDFRSAVELMRLVSPELAARHEKYSQVPSVLTRKARVLSGEEEIVL
ncbi:hypothetical protein [Streptomyces sp. NPDC057496]|uniref:hypothetical protein n=1 Tax=Streptomyces sp. NPDC057496 TaxID=3346149 RepID=UPI00369D85E1